MKHLRKHVSPGLVIGLIALITAMSGSAVALKGKNSVDKGDLKKNAVGASELGVFGTYSVSVGVPAGQNAELTVPCGNGQAVSGGVKWDNPNPQNDNRINESYLSGNGWYARAENQSGNPRTLTAEVYCLKK